MRGSMKYLLLVATLLVGALLFAACGGDNGNDTGNGNGDPEATEPANGEGNGDSNGNTGSSLDELAEAYGDREFKVTYNMTATGTEATVVTLYWKPQVGWRVDFSAGDEQNIAIGRDDVTYLCSPSNGGGSCVQAPGGTGIIPIPFFGLLTNPTEFEGFVTGTFGGVDFDRSEREIAGRSAECLSASAEAQGVQGETEFCVSEGILLLFRGAAEGQGFSIEATDVETSVADADLEPPYDVEQIPGLEDIPQAP